MSRRLVASIMGVALLAGPGLALSQPVDLRNPEFMAQVEVGFRHIYDLDYQEARNTFEALQERYPSHPAPPIYVAMSIWLRELFTRQELDLDKFIAPSHFDRPTSRTMPASDRQLFFSLIEQSQQLSQAILEKEPANPDARYFLGSSEGVLASFAITVDRSKSTAFDHGKRAYKLHQQLVEENRQYYDAYLSVGLYEYVVGNLPWYIKWLAAIVGYRGSVQRGFEYLELAATRGQFVKDDARVLQMVLFVREKRFSEALANVRLLEAKAPRNFILRLNEAHVLENLQRPMEALAVYRETLKRAEAGEPNYHLMPLQTMRYTLGKKFWELGQPDLALRALDESWSHSDTPERERALSGLLSGQILDSLGRRGEALSRYRRVLELQDIEQSHRQARKYLQNAYQSDS